MEVLNTFTKSIRVINRYCHWYIHKILDEFRLGGPDPIILSFLNGKDASSQDCLCRFLLLDKATMAKAAARLEEQGYICRKVNEQNKREKLLSLTEKGRQTVEQIDCACARWESICLEGFTEEEQAQFTRLSELAAQNAVQYRMKKERDTW